VYSQDPASWCSLGMDARRVSEMAAFSIKTDDLSIKHGDLTKNNWNLTIKNDELTSKGDDLSIKKNGFKHQTD
jgi:hypothetical protein